MADEYVSRAEFNVTIKGLEGNIHSMTQSVNKVVDKVDKLGDKVDETGRAVAQHDQSLGDLDKTVDKLSTVIDKWADTIIRVDKETAVNTNNIQWDWKMILAAGFMITILVGVIANAISAAM